MSVNILLAENLSKAFGEKLLFENLTFGLDLGQKVALIAANGSGKSTLMNIIAGKEDADQGKVVLRKDIRLAYLPQNPVFDPQMLLREALLDSDDPLTCLVREYEDCQERIISGGDPGVQEEMNRLIERMDRAGAWDYERKISEILSRLGLTGLNQKTGELSGGQRKRLALARVLIGEYDLILLDEPTNHLDISMIEWLEEFLAPQKLSLLMVTHDRYFLDQVCDEVVELDRGQLIRYKGNYRYYLEKKEERFRNELAETEKAKNLYRRELEWMRRMPQARGTKAKARIESFYELEEKARRKQDEGMARFDSSVRRIGGKVLEMNNVSKSFGDMKVLDDFTYTFKKGERIGIAGPNGSGKSTLLNIITEHLSPDAGKISKGQTIEFGYFSQEGLRPKGDPRVIEMVKEIAEEVPMGKGSVSASQFLSYFQFSHQNQYSYFSSLSGGEKRRLALLCVLMRNPNFLILDEPTNDLDINTLRVLEEYLLQYPGCLMIVSHDRFFLDQLVDHLFVFETQGKIKDFYGNYSEYRIWRNKQRVPEQKQSVRRDSIPGSRKEDKKPSLKPTYKERQEFEALGEEIGLLEKEKQRLMDVLNSGSASSEELMQASVQFADTEKRLESSTDRWLELAEKIDN